jgi:hypothetical protein
LPRGAKKKHEKPSVKKTSERPVNIQQAAKCLAGSVVICELWGLAIALYMLVVLSRGKSGQ